MKRFASCGGVILLWFASLAAAQSGAPIAVHLITGRVNVRDVDGGILCSIGSDEALEAIARHSDGERLQVSLHSKGCPSTGFVYSFFVEPSVADRATVTTVAMEGLSLRDEPRSDGKWLCGMNDKATIQIVPEPQRIEGLNTWLKIRLLDPKPGCPSEGYANAVYFTPSAIFNDLPVAQESVPVEAGIADCKECPGKVPANHQHLKEVATAAAPIPEAPKDTSYMAGLRKLIQNPQARPPQLTVSRDRKHLRNLVQMPLLGKNSGPCGSHHYNSDPRSRSPGSNDFANPLTACALLAVMQDWKKNVCPNNSSGCRLAIGDISDETKPYYDSHHNHTDGFCFDARPFRKGEFVDAGNDYCVADSSGRSCLHPIRLNPSYDRPMTEKYISMLKAAGASTIFFNDTSSGAETWPEHNNHIHACFLKNPTVEKTCANFKPDLKICPELQ